MSTSRLPAHKTKIVATIGPASDSPQMLARLVAAGMDVARLNLSHGSFDDHARRIERLRAAEREAGRRLVIMADLPGPKIRLGVLEPDTIELVAGAPFTLTVAAITGSSTGASITFPDLPSVARPGDRLFINDGIVQLIVEKVDGCDVLCRVAVGGEIRSRKGVNLPGLALGLSAFTEHDRACLAFVLAQGVDAVSQSFVERAADIQAVRQAAAETGHRPFVIAKIERANALEHIDEILREADGLMVARGDLGVEVPIAEVAVVQKRLIARAVIAGKPVITATQMLESMVTNRLPTRAEATDVANAILDGTDAVMLSAESASGRYPEESVAMLAAIAAATEPHRPPVRDAIARRVLRALAEDTAASAMASVVEHALETVPCDVVFVPTRTGRTARMIARYRPSAWVVALSYDHAVCHHLQFSYGVHAHVVPQMPADWVAYVRQWADEHGLGGSRAMLITGPSEGHPGANYRVEFLGPVA